MSSRRFSLTKTLSSAFTSSSKDGNADGDRDAAAPPAVAAPGRRFSLAKTLSSALLSSEEKKDNDGSDDNVPAFLSSELGPRVASIIEGRADRIHDDSFLKMVRQLDFWHGRGLPEDEFLALAERLARIASWREDADDESIPETERFEIPKVRFGRTGLEMPIVTCGGMRVQETWVPDNTPLLGSNKSKVIKSKSQANLKDVVLSCIKVGLNHFETARMYGSSEIQFVDALAELMNEGTIQRSDFIFQTKLFVGASAKRADFQKLWEASWSNVKQLGHVDLFAFHAVSKNDQVDSALSDDDDGVYKFALELQEEGKIKHIGFSTHGSAETIMRMISSQKFSFVNLHKHFFGDYHAAGTPTPNGAGGQGNAACVKKALELDMGVFCISPFDKGGKLYRPSVAVAEAIGPELSPVAFSALHAWKSMGMHTVSAGFARPSDLDEVVEAARIYAEGERADSLVKAAESRLKDVAVKKLGKDWYEKGLLNVPSFFDESTDGMAIGHMLWLHNCLTAYGMYEFSKDRYGPLESASASWSKSKSFEENVKKFDPGNCGRSYDEGVDLTEALKNHYDPDLVRSKLAEVRLWLKKDASLTEGDRAAFGWKMAYNLTTWEEFPGDMSSLTPSRVVLGRMGLKKLGGNSKEAEEEAKVMRSIVRRTSVTSLED